MGFGICVSCSVQQCSLVVCVLIGRHESHVESGFFCNILQNKMGFRFEKFKLASKLSNSKHRRPLVKDILADEVNGTRMLLFSGNHCVGVDRSRGPLPLVFCGSMKHAMRLSDIGQMHRVGMNACDVADIRIVTVPKRFR